MNNVTVPKGYNQVMPYLILKNAKGFIKFAETVFGAELNELHTHEDGSTVMHAQITIGECMIMIGEASGEWGPDNASMFIYVDNADERYQLALDNGATSVMPLSDQPYGRTCGVKDPFGNTWWITHHVG